MGINTLHSVSSKNSAKTRCGRKIGAGVWVASEDTLVTCRNCLVNIEWENTKLKKNV